MMVGASSVPRTSMCVPAASKLTCPGAGALPARSPLVIALDFDEIAGLDGGAGFDDHVVAAQQADRVHRLQHQRIAGQVERLHHQVIRLGIEAARIVAVVVRDDQDVVAGVDALLLRHRAGGGYSDGTRRHHADQVGGERAAERERALVVDPHAAVVATPSSVPTTDLMRLADSPM
jgi:hypothetical protein